MTRYILSAIIILTATAFANSKPTVLFDFRNGNANNWIGNMHIAKTEATEEGFRAICSGGEDPWIEGPKIPSLPEGNYDKIQIDITLKTTSGSIELFYGPGFTAGNAISFGIKKRNEWTTESVIIPRLEPGSRLRLDPEGGPGEITVALIQASPIIPLFEAPDFEKATRVDLGMDPPTLTSGILTLKHNETTWDAFRFDVDNQPFAWGHDQPKIIFLVNDKPQTVELNKIKATTKTTKKSIVSTIRFKDEGNANWIATRTFSKLGDGDIQVTTTFRCDQDRDLLHVPWLTLFPGQASFGQKKTQAMLAGVEYLVDEPSSDTKDVIGPKANRLMVHDYKLCFPLMAISYENRWLSLEWEYEKFPATIFDSPDRLIKSGGHLFALWSPSTKDGRFENDLTVYKPLRWKAKSTQSLKMIVSAGNQDETMASAIDRYTQRNPLPPVPIFEDEFQGALELMAHGWLDSVINVDGNWRHAYVQGSGFGARPAMDGILMLDYIRVKTKDKKLAQKIQQELEAIKQKRSPENYHASVSHDYNHFYTFLYLAKGDEWLNAHLPSVNGLFKEFRQDGSYRYRIPEPPAKNYGTTHWTDHANGLTAAVMTGMTRVALATGNIEYRENYLKLLDKVLELYKNDVPRGAQTWEIPLHTPDILASAYIVAHCTAAYRITGDENYLKHAEYWALTGLPFVYLVNPMAEINPDGTYGTIAVLGATAWAAPMWVGLPVQWCGCVYRNALYQYVDELKDKDRKKFWSTIADGITTTGLQFSFQKHDGDEPSKWGLLPDAYGIMARSKGGPAINPGTVQLTMPLAYGETPIFNVKSVKTGICVHALGDIKPTADNKVKLNLWPQHKTHVVVSGLSEKPAAVTWNGKEVQDAKWLDNHKAIVVPLLGKGTLAW